MFRSCQLFAVDAIWKSNYTEGVLDMKDMEVSSAIEPEDDDKNGPTVLFEAIDSVPAFLQGMASG